MTQSKQDRAKERLLKQHPVTDLDRSKWPEPEARKPFASAEEQEATDKIEKKIRKDIVEKTITVTNGYKKPVFSVVQEVVYYPWEPKYGISKLGILVGGEWYYISMDQYWSLRVFRKIQIV